MKVDILTVRSFLMSSVMENNNGKYKTLKSLLFIPHTTRVIYCDLCDFIAYIHLDALTPLRRYLTAVIFVLPKCVVITEWSLLARVLYIHYILRGIT